MLSIVPLIFAVMLNRCLLLIVISGLFHACIPNEPGFDGYRRVELQRVLSNGDQKKWMLTARTSNNELLDFEDCEIPRQLVLNFTSSVTDIDSAFYINYDAACLQHPDTLAGLWFVPITETAFITTDTLGLAWEGGDTAYFLVTEANAELLQFKTILSDSLSEKFVVLNTTSID